MRARHVLAFVALMGAAAPACTSTGSLDMARVQSGVSIFRKAMTLVCRGFTTIEPYLPSAPASDAAAPAPDASAADPVGVALEQMRGGAVLPPAGSLPRVSSGGSQ